MENSCWAPSNEDVQNSNIFSFIQYIQNKYDIRIFNYKELHNWSINNPEEFWLAIWDFCDIVYSEDYKEILNNPKRINEAKWFSGAKLNFTENLLKYKYSDNIAIKFSNEVDPIRELSFKDLYHEVSKVQQYLIGIGIKEGDRVAAYMPNIPETVICMLATASIGAIWTSCSPDFGVNGVLDRFEQVQPKIFISANGYYYKGKKINLSNKIELICNSFDSVENILIINYIAEDLLDVNLPKVMFYDKLAISNKDLQFAQLPFNTPLYIMYSSGTTGKPKSIVHSAGGTLIQHKKELILHSNLKEKDVIFYYTTCGWMMWNWLVSSLSVGATIVLYDGNPFYPNNSSLLSLIDKFKINIFGTSAQYISYLEKKQVYPNEISNFDSLNTILSTGSPLGEASYDFVYSKWKKNVQLSSISGGTDIISCFVLGNPMLPVYRGEIQCIGLGMNVKSFDSKGRQQINKKGELVCLSPFPSMPIYFWNDIDDIKYKAAYFSKYNNIWTHGDYIRIDHNGNIKIFGRSDATLNPGGVRIGTSEIYTVIEKMSYIDDCVIISHKIDDEDRIILFVVANDKKLDNHDTDLIKNKIKNECSPRHVPYKVIQAPSVPYTINGKKVELAIKSVVNNEEVTNYDSLSNPESLEFFRLVELDNA